MTALALVVLWQLTNGDGPLRSAPSGNRSAPRESRGAPCENRSLPPEKRGAMDVRRAADRNGPVVAAALWSTVEPDPCAGVHPGPAAAPRCALLAGWGMFVGLRRLTMKSSGSWRGAARPSHGDFLETQDPGAKWVRGWIV